ncbi:MAG TPA: hypothetical protein GXX28_09150 [Firmicutes bacterium]|nr:hypothetical protein [Bacillota bacterium]
MQPIEMTEVHEGRRYDTRKATLIASDAYWDGHNWERRGRNRFLYRTPRGRYFVQHRTQWQGERDRLEPVSQNQALALWENELPEHEVTFEEAFPGVQIEEA